MKPYWTLDEALGLIRALQPETRQFNYHLCLGGGVLNKGESQKDLDLYFLPMNNGEKRADPGGLIKWLDCMWGLGSNMIEMLVEYDPGSTRDNMMERWKEDGYLQKLKYKYCDLRIDVFVIGVE